MQTWSITLYGPASVLSTVDTGESQFVIGTETASDVFTVHGDGVTERHAWVWISEAGLQVEDLGGGTLVNGYQITERVQVEYPASVQVGEVTLVIELKRVEPVAASPTPSSLDVTIPQRAVTKSKASMEVTIPQRTPTRSNVQKAGSTSTSSPQSTPANKAPLTGEYTLVKEIARGGMGQIYFGEDPQLKRNVAVKVSSVSEGGEDPRFSKEAEVLAQLAHPNIVPIYNIGVDAQSRPFYSMKLIKGRTLQAVLNLIRDGDAVATKEYPRATLLTIFRKVCDAMMFAHSKGILHRDLKPENIMVGEYGEVLVMDWGLAKVLGEREESSSAVGRVNDTGDYGMTMEGEVMGTPQYMSPEQAMGMVAELDARSDIYSLGGILYAILTMRPPIDGTTLDEVLTKVKNGSISSMVTKRGGKGAVTVGTPSAMGAEVPEALQAVTLKAMATDRNTRYGSVEAFAGDIERYQNGFATQAEDAGSFKKFVLFVKRNKGVSALAAVIFVGAAWFMVRLAASERSALEKSEISRREAARTQLALAESAEREGDAIQMQDSLNAVPEDLRDPTWRYLAERLDKSDVDILPAADRNWLGMDDLPADPESMLALDSSGEVSEVNLANGQIKPRWIASAPDVLPSKFCVSSTGNVAAVGFTKGNVGVVKIYGVGDAKELATFNLSHGCSRIWTSDTVVVVSGGDKIEAFQIGSDKPLWNRPAKGRTMTFSFSADQKQLYLLNPEGRLETWEPITGQVVSVGEKTMASVNGNLPESAGVFSNGTRVFHADPAYSKHALRAWVNGDLKFLVQTPGLGMLFLSFLSKHNLVVGLCPNSAKKGVLEFRDCNKGYLLKQIPLILPSNVGFSGASVRCKEDFVALRLKQKIRVWKIQVSTPKASVVSPLSVQAANIHGSGNTPRMLAVNAVIENATAKTLVSLAEIAAGGKQTRELSRCEFKGFGPTRCPDLYGDSGGSRFVAGIDGAAAGFRIDQGVIHQLWKVKWVGSSLILHPSLDLLWTENGLFDFATGEKRVETKKGIFEAVFNRHQNTGVWIGAERVLHIGYWGQAASDAETDPAVALSKSLVLWDTTTGESVLSIVAHKAEALCVSPDATMIAEAGQDKRVRIRDARTLKILQEFRVHDSAVNDVAWHPLLPVLVTYSWEDKKIRVWNLKDCRMVEEFTLGSATGEGRMVISPDGRQLIVSSKSMHVYEPKTFVAK